MKNLPLFLASILLSLTGLSVHAGEKQSIQYEPPPPAARSVFEKGRWEYSSLWQGYASFGDRPTINTLMSSYRLGYMLTAPGGEGWYRGNYELMIEGLYASVLKGPGDWIAGGSLIARRNFIPHDGKWTWYAQVGGGVAWNDIYKDRVQTLVGRSREFSLLGGVGLRYQFNAKWSIGGEIGYRYLFNAGASSRDDGLNSIGGGIGLGYTF
jgi:hypothetical protein